MKPTVQPRDLTAVAKAAATVMKFARAFGKVKFTPEFIMETVDRTTGLEDYHPEEVAEPLELLCADLAASPPSDSGALAVFTELIRAQSARRRAQRIDPKLSRPSRPPIVIAGWYRTGTTFLEKLLHALPGYGYVPCYDLIEPHSNWFAPIKVDFGLRLMHSLTPEMKVLHPTRYDGPTEDWLTLGQHMIVDGYAFHWDVPRYEDWLYQVDRQPAYDNWARNLAAFEQRLNRGLVLKDPCHMNAISEILEAAPDARIIWTHRDPVEAIGSFGSLSCVQHRQVYDSYDPERAGRKCMLQFRRYLDRGMAARESVPEGQLVDVPHDALRRDATGAVEEICRVLDLPFDAEAIRNREAEIMESRKKRTRHIYDIAQWGLTEETVYSQLADYELPEDVGRHDYAGGPIRHSA